MARVDKDMTISELLEKDPEAAEDLMIQGLGCFGCPMAAMETIEEGIAGHGMDPKKVIGELNSKK